MSLNDELMKDLLLRTQKELAEHGRHFDIVPDERGYRLPVPGKPEKKIRITKEGEDFYCEIGTPDG